MNTESAGKYATANRTTRAQRDAEEKPWASHYR